MTLSTSTKPSGAISYVGTASDLAEHLADLLGACGRTTASAATPRHNEIVRAIDRPTDDMLRVVMWTKYGNAPGIRMVTAKYNGLVWRTTDDDFIPTPTHKGVISTTHNTYTNK